MSGLTWQELLAPDYVLAFIDSFLMAFLPALGLGTAVEGAGAIDVTVWPSIITVLGAIGLGIMNGVKTLRNLRAPTPTPRPTLPPHPLTTETGTTSRT